MYFYFPIIYLSKLNILNEFGFLLLKLERGVQIRMANILFLSRLITRYFSYITGLQRGMRLVGRPFVFLVKSC